MRPWTPRASPRDYQSEYEHASGPARHPTPRQVSAHRLVRGQDSIPVGAGAVWRRGLRPGDVVREHPPSSMAMIAPWAVYCSGGVGRIPEHGDAPVDPRRDRVAVQHVPPAVPPHQRDAWDTFSQVPSKGAPSSPGMPSSPGRSGPWVTRTGARALANEGRRPSEPGLVTASPGTTACVKVTACLENGQEALLGIGVSGATWSGSRPSSASGCARRPWWPARRWWPTRSPGASSWTSWAAARGPGTSSR